MRTVPTQPRRGQILDLHSGVLNPPENCDSILKMGYWEEHPLTAEMERGVLDTDVRMIKGFVK
ncbi:hypothetical protein [Falsibacillus albus]|uniref:Uncharacterized protein n=1 Tax=Falsibacillus albus TaxID=2478915 RepID=A0A3L7JYP4_9BACI|nr:hypothetical protein [Falsibacillus albus]RLQ94821.1 hypothetical protein D9X91_12585 [Falsibacillus albus]